MFRPREFLISALSAPEARAEPSPGTARWQALKLLAASGAAVWIFLYKLDAFHALTTTSDLYQFTQLSLSWLEGRFLHDNCYGEHLAIHTYFFCPILAVFTYPLGAIGLLLALALAAALNVWGIQRLLATLALPRWLSLPFALIVTAMPFSISNYQDLVYGFHVELLQPAMAVWLAYFLLVRNWPGTLLVALAILSIKEDAAILVTLVAIMIGCETAVRSLAGPSKPTETRWLNRHAVVVAGMAVAALLVCLVILQTYRSTEPTVGSFRRLQPEGGAAITGSTSLVHYLVQNLGSWLNSTRITRWAELCVAGSFGLILLRPHFVLLGLVATLVSWLMKDDLLWAPRFAHALAFLQITACLGLASAWQLVHPPGSGRHRQLAAGFAVLLLGASIVWSYLQQWAELPHTSEVYCLEPRSRFNREELLAADRVFALYRRESRKEEPVIASAFLFRYAHDRNLYWYDPRANQPRPDWILWDAVANPLAAARKPLRPEQAVNLSDYDLIAQEGRFSLYRRKGLQ